VDEKTQVSFQKKDELLAMRNTVIAPVKGWNHSHNLEQIVVEAA
jgi:hypothetical protein